MDKLKEIIYWKWHMFWYHLIYKQKRIGNYRKQINRFTGEHKVYEVHPLARLGVNLNQEQRDLVMQLMGDERVRDAQEIILQKIEKETLFPEIADTLVKVAHDLDTERDRLEREEIEAWTG